MLNADVPAGNGILPTPPVRAKYRPSPSDRINSFSSHHDLGAAVIAIFTDVLQSYTFTEVLKFTEALKRLLQLGTERLGSWARVAQRGQGRAGLQTQVVSILGCVLNHSFSAYIENAARVPSV